jgi:hypothetical protein
MKGPRGAKGSKGSKGSTGAKGAKASGVSGTSRRRLIAAVDRHIENIYGELTLQMNRLAKLQSQVDDLRDKVRRVVG